MTGFKPGEIVDITIKGVPVVQENTDGTVTVLAAHTDGGPSHWQMPPQAAIERVGPAGWPPRPGDLWREGVDGGLWFIFCERNPMERSPSGLRGREANGYRWTDDALSLIDNARLTLVHREGNQRGPVVFEDPLTARLDEQGEVPL